MAISSDAASDCGEVGSYDSDDEPEWIRYIPRGSYLQVRNKLGDVCTLSTAYQRARALHSLRRLSANALQNTHIRRVGGHISVLPIPHARAAGFSPKRKRSRPNDDIRQSMLRLRAALPFVTRQRSMEGERIIELDIKPDLHRGRRGLATQGKTRVLAKERCDIATLYEME